MSYALTFDGHDIGASYAVERHVTRQLGNWEPSLMDVPGRDGAAFAGTRRLPVELTFDIYATEDTREGRQASMRRLASWLAVDAPKPLYLGDEGDLYRLALPTSTSDQEASLDSDHVGVAFTCPDPRLVGPSHELAITSGADFEVLGTAPTGPTITATGATNGAGGYWRATDEAGNAIHVVLAAGSHTIVADCESRTLKVDGTVTALHPAYDWMEWAPGTHALTIVGGGTVSVAYSERWW